MAPNRDYLAIARLVPEIFWACRGFRGSTELRVETYLAGLQAFYAAVPASGVLHLNCHSFASWDRFRSRYLDCKFGGQSISCRANPVRPSLLSSTPIHLSCFFPPQSRPSSPAVPPALFSHRISSVYPSTDIEETWVAATIVASITALPPFSPPFDLTKICLQASGDKRMMTALQKTLRTAGVRGFSDGISGNVLFHMSLLEF
ncbi:hypothetical protein B0H19DRAFT_1258931 [Mycena capillaripes]|nr:hypothetical protein B0H19DRAFT_1258931 [Mycena capillaripes]